MVVGAVAAVVIIPVAVEVVLILQSRKTLDSSCCTAASVVSGHFELYCCGWTVQVVLQRLLCLDSSGCTAVAGQFMLYCSVCCVWTVGVVL